VRPFLSISLAATMLIALFTADCFAQGVEENLHKEILP
jgi:hypothetical protein